MRNNKHPTIEIAGVPNSGKSTIINSLLDKLNKLGIDYQYLHGLKSYKRFTPSLFPIIYNTYGLCSNFKNIESRTVNYRKKIIKALQSSIRFERSTTIYDIINDGQISIIEEGIFSTVRPFLYGVEDEFELILKKNLSELEKYPDYIIFLNVDYQEIIKRRGGGNIWIKKSFFSNEILKKYILKNSNIKVLQYDNDSNSSIHQITEEIIKIIE